MPKQQPFFKEGGAPERAGRLNGHLNSGRRRLRSCGRINRIVKQLNKGLTDGANDSPLGLELPQQKQQRGEGGEAGEGLSWTPGLGSAGLHQCTHHANAVIRKQRKNMLMKQLVF